MVNKFIAKDTDQYFKEKDKRFRKYKEICSLSGKAWDLYEKNKTKENHDAFFKIYRKVDESYMDWTDGVTIRSDSLESKDQK